MTAKVKKIVRFFIMAGLVLMQIVMPFSFFGTNASAAGTHVCSGKCGTNVTYSMYVYTYTEYVPGSVYSSKMRYYYKFILTIEGAGSMNNLLDISSAEPWLNQEVTEMCNNVLGVTPYGIDVVIENGVTAIGDYAFYGNGYINPFGSTGSRYYSISIGNTVKTIGKYAFKDNGVISSIDLPSSVITIKEGAFENCHNLTSINIPANVTTIENSTFAECKKLTSVTIPNGVTSIGKSAFENCPIKKIEIPPNVGSIGENAFKDGDKQEAIAFIPQGSISLSENALYSAESVLKYTIGSDGVNIAEIASNTSFDLSEKSITLYGENVLGRPVVFVDKNYRKYVRTCGSHTVQSYDEDGECKICGYKCKHSNASASEWKQGNGKHWKICGDCGCKLDIGNHTEEVIISEITATCETDGRTKETVCSVCGQKTNVSEIIPALGHSFTNYSSNNDATCIKDGTKTAKCDRCEATETITDNGSKVNGSHDPDNSKWTQENDNHWKICGDCGHILTEPENCRGGYNTCKEKAVCDVCRCEYGDYGAHNEIVQKDDKRATCESDGLTPQKYCTICGYSRPREIVHALGHTFQNYISNNDATCTEDGTKTARCIRCRATDTIPDVGTKGHTPEWRQKNGVHWKICSRCNFEFIAPENCRGGKATCKSAAVCEICGRKYGEPVHTNIVEWGNPKPATCEEDGKTQSKLCYDCGKLIEGEAIPALGHSFTKYISDNNVTCTSDGTKTAKCDRCSVTDTITETKLGHNFTDYVSDNNATCAEDGTKTRTCIRCGETDTVSDIGSAKGHSFGTDWIWDTDAHWYECECGEKSGIAAHIPDEGTIDAETGSRIFRCNVCGAVTSKSSSVLLGDVNGDGKINNTDIILLGRSYMAGTWAQYLDVADMNDDGNINNADIILLGRLYMSQQL